ncbi:MULTISPECIES: phage tail length tape measure family protein [unclassified Pseudovibrio]|uniref:phage tail length tape measure family protein n=1 Tax=unclassified Pseudovibrio TaxID=2627060 RepID=UPI0007AE9552|nr:MULTISPECIES: phage tail length tape measure family protein [unclassified Pseudovibrio]KZL00487.1 Prophage tail length tape measure protein [Pseudovibrio sp. W74]KZL07487.1 Prophage tail length tape measure protein [Pseudovibrio sp. Ad14]
MGKNSGLTIPLEVTYKKFHDQMSRSAAAAVKSSNRMAAENKKLQKQLEQTQQKFAKLQASAGGMNDNFGKIGKASQGAGKEMQGFLNVSKGSRFAIQNTSNQVADMAVQFEMGTDPMRVMGQQIPQLIAGFGALTGTVGLLMPVLGVIAGIGFPLAGVLLSMGDNAEGASKKVDAFTKAFNEAESAISRANSSIADYSKNGLENIRDKYGEVTSAVLNLVAALAELDSKAAQTKTDTALDTFFDDFLGGNNAFAELDLKLKKYQAIQHRIAQLSDPLSQSRSIDAIGLEGVENTLKDLNQELEASSDLVKIWATEMAALEDARASGNMERVSEALAKMREILTKLPDEKLAEVGKELARVESIARQSVSTTKRLKTATDGVELKGLSADATTMANEISRAADAMEAMKRNGLTSLEDAQVRLKYKDDPVSRAGALAALEFDRTVNPLAQQVGPTGGTQLAKEREEYIRMAREQARLQEALRPAANKGPDVLGMGDQEVTALERRIEMLGRTREEVAALTTKYKLLDMAKQQGLDLDERSVKTGLTLREEIEARSKSVSQLTGKIEEQTRQSRMMASVNQSITNSLTDVIFEGERFVDVLGNMGKGIAKMLLQSSVSSMTSSVGGGGNIVGIISTLLSSFGGFFAEGGNLGAGKWGIAGEGGVPELIEGPATITPFHKLPQSSGGGGEMVSRVILEVTPDLEARIESVSGNVVKEAAPMIIEAATQNSREYTVGDFSMYEQERGGGFRD